MMMDSLMQIISRNRATNCLDCGKCSAVCPITRWGMHGYASPRLLVEKATQGEGQAVLDDELFWSCLTCKRCAELCPSQVSFSEFVRDLRSLGRAEGRSGTCTHSGAVHTWCQMMTQPDLHQNRLGWRTSDLKVSDHSDTLYFTGCLPYYDTLFGHLGFEGVKIAQAAIKIMNHLGIHPQVLADERCCGHDQLWQGDLETFRALALLNLEQFANIGVKRIVTTCPECARTLKVDYPQLVGSHSLEVLHIAELLSQSDICLLQGATRGRTLSEVKETPSAPLVTYQDPCRLGRHLGVYDAPRKVLGDLGFTVAEMAHNRHTSLCCGTSCWTSCGSANKNIQVERMSEAKATGADLLVTACLKCQIHFKCAQHDPNIGEKINIQMQDLTTLVAERLS